MRHLELSDPIAAKVCDAVCNKSIYLCGAIG